MGTAEEGRPLNAERQLDCLCSYLTHFKQTSLILKITQSEWLCSMQIQHCIIALLKDAEPFSASTWCFPSDRNLEFWKGTVVHTNSLLLLSLMWTNLSSLDSSCTVPVSDYCVVSFCSFFFLSLIYLITHLFIYLFIYFCPVSLVNRLQDTRHSYIRGNSRISQRLKSLQSVLTLGSCALCHISPRQLAVWALICQL